MNEVELNLEGRRLYLSCNAAACFEIYDEFGYDKNIIDLIQAKGSVGYGNTLRIASILSEHGEVFRRWEGRETQPYATVEELTSIVTPLSYIKLKRAVIEAVKRGFLPTVEDRTRPRMTDRGLAELEKNEKKTASAGLNTCT